MTLPKRTLAALAVALLLAGSAAAVAPKARAKAKSAQSYPTGVFTVSGQTVMAKDVLDARAIPDMQGNPSLMITLAPEAVARLHPAAGVTQIPCTLDGKPLGESPADALTSDNVLQLSGSFGNYDATAALARRISGKDPLPESEGE